MTTIPAHMRPLFWDVNPDDFDPSVYPQYTIERVLEHGDEADVAWLVQHFTREQIRDVLRTDANLSGRSAQFWALVFELPAGEVSALREQH
jgi:hypothetical protein